MSKSKDVEDDMPSIPEPAEEDLESGANLQQKPSKSVEVSNEEVEDSANEEEEGAVTEATTAITEEETPAGAIVATAAPAGNFQLEDQIFLPHTNYLFTI